MVPGAGLEPARGFPQGIFVPLQLSLLHARSTCICGLDFTFAIPSRARIRQGPSSLYTFLGGTHAMTRGRAGKFDHINGNNADNIQLT